MPRIYLSQPLKINSIIVLLQDIAHHLQHVLRLKVNDEIIVFNGEGGEFKARIVEVNKKQIKINILEWQKGIRIKTSIDENQSILTYKISKKYRFNINNYINIIIYFYL